MSTTQDDIVERLKAPAYYISGSSEGHEGENRVPYEAAAKITRLRVDLVAENALRKGFQARAKAAIARANTAEARLGQSKYEVDTLRTAMQTVTAERNMLRAIVDAVISATQDYLPPDGIDEITRLREENVGLQRTVDWLQGLDAKEPSDD